MRTRTAAALGAAAALAGIPAAAGAATVRITGSVVHHNARAHSFVVAGPGGRLYAIHGRAPALARTVTLTATSLRDGTFRLRHARVEGLHRHVRIRGVVTHVDRRAGDFTVSAPGVSLLVVRPRHAARAADAGPSTGTDVVVTGNVDDQGALDEQSVATVGQENGAYALEGRILAVDASARTLTVSADDDNLSGQSITVSVPDSFDISGFAPGDEVELNVAPTGNGTATLVGSADDSNAQSANNGSDEQGDVGDESGSTSDGTPPTASGGDSSTSGGDSSTSGGDFSTSGGDFSTSGGDFSTSGGGE